MCQTLANLDLCITWNNGICFVSSSKGAFSWLIYLGNADYIRIIPSRRQIFPSRKGMLTCQVDGKQANSRSLHVDVA